MNNKFIALAYDNYISNISSIYIKDGIVIKNRGGDIGNQADNNLTKWLKMSNNNLVVENNEKINIYCTKEKEKYYRDRVQYIKNNFNTDIEDKVSIYLVNGNKHKHNHMNDDLIKTLNQCNKDEITVLRINVDKKELIGEDDKGRLTKFSFDELMGV